MVGTNNALTATNGSAANPARMASFLPGTSTTAYTVTWSPTSKTDPVSWALIGHAFSFTDQITSCTSKPVPVVANETFGGDRCRRPAGRGPGQPSPAPARS